MKRRVGFPLIAAATLAIGATVAFALPAGAAVSVQSQSPPVAAVKLGNTATLDAKGAVVFAPVKVTCTPGDFAELSVSVTENVGNAIASGMASQDVQPCTGSVQKVTMAVTPTQKPFKRGVAFGQAWLQVCNSFSCHTFQSQHNIQIVAKK
jgi:hypothetical protein